MKDFQTVLTEYRDKFAELECVEDLDQDDVFAAEYVAKDAKEAMDMLIEEFKRKGF